MSDAVVPTDGEGDVDCDGCDEIILGPRKVVGEDRVNNAVNKLIGRIQDETTPPSDKPDATDGVSGENSGG